MRRFRPSYKKRSSKSRKSYARKRYARRKANKANGVIRLVRRAPEQTIVNTAVAGTVSNTASATVLSLGAPVSAGFTNYFHVPVGAAFTLQDIYNAADIVNLCDKYKISWVKLKFYSTSTIASSSSTAQLPSLLWSTDEDDASTPTIAQLKEKMNSKQRMFYPGKPITVFLRPKMVRQVDTSLGAYIGNEVAPARFINTSQSNVPHYGFKAVIMDMNLSNNTTAYTQIKCDITYCIVGKNFQ